MNALNTVNVIGRIPATEKLPFNFIEKDDPTKNFMSFMVSVRRAYKSKDAEYAEEDLMPVKAFGHNATFIHNYIKRGDTVAIMGELRREADWEDKDGNQRRGELCIYVDSVKSIASKSSAKSNDADEDEETVAPKKASNGAASLKNRLRNRKAGAHI